MNRLNHLWVILNKPTVDYHFEALSRSYTKADIEKRHLNPRHLMCYIFYVKKKKPLSPAYLDGVNVVLKQVYIHVLEIQVPVIW